MFSNIADVARRLVQFTAKLRNSKIPECGVRVARDSAVDLPFVGVRTLLADGIDVPLDYAKKTGSIQETVRKIRLAENGVIAGDEADEILSIMRDVRETTLEVGTEAVSVRLRQILLPVGQNAIERDSYLSVTPLESTGFSALLRKKLAVLERKKPKFRKGILPFGGSNPRNVGAWGVESQNPIVFLAPDEHEDDQLEKDEEYFN